MDEIKTTQVTRRQVLKGIGAGGVAVGAGAVLAACGTSSTPASASAGAGASGMPSVIPSKRDLRVWMPWPVDFSIVQGLIETTVAEYEATYPGKKVEVVGVPSAEFGTKLATGRLSGDLPDVMAPDTDRGPAYFFDMLLPLDDFLADVGIPTDDWVGSLRTGWTFGDKMYGLPAICGTKCYIYRKDFLAEAGITTFPNDWASFRDAAIALTQKDSAGTITRSGFYMGRTGDTQEFITLAMQNGGSQWDPADINLGDAVITSPEFQEAFTKYFDLKRVDGVVPLEGTVLNPGEWATISGKAAIEMQGPWWVPAITRSGPAEAEQLAIGLPLQGSAARAGIGDSGGSFAVWKDSEVLDDALNFLRIWLQEDNYLKYHDQLANPDSPFAAITGRKSMNAKLEWLQNDAIMKNMPEWLEALDYGVDVGWRHTANREADLNLWGPAMERAISQAQPDAEILAALAVEMNKVRDNFVRQK